MMTPHSNRALNGDRTVGDDLLDTAFAFWRATLLLSADELGVFAALNDGPAEAQTLQSRLGLDANTAADFLAALADLGLVEVRDAVYCNTATSARYLDPANPEYLGPWLAMARAAHRDMTTFTEQLRDPTRRHTTDAPLAGRMWAELSAILNAAGNE